MKLYNDEHKELAMVLIDFKKVFNFRLVRVPNWIINLFQCKLTYDKNFQNYAKR